MDKQKAPQSLEELITDGYLKAVPVDPFTQSKDTWVTDSNGALYSVDQTEPGIDDVHSGSQELSAGGQLYSTW
jgi:general secretion pathway protein G